ncbi:MAG: hypothetical protein LAT84_02060 [Balneolia bacterium]|nr:hypothetical protein [Balneolia bacterium]
MHFSKLLPAAIPILSLLWLAGCGVNDADTDTTVVPFDLSDFESDITLLTGSWNWEYTASFDNDTQEPFVQTPASTGTSRMLLFPGDGQMEFYIDGDLDQTQNINEYLSNRRWGVRGDSLAISEAHLGGPETLYLRAD